MTPIAMALGQMLKLLLPFLYRQSIISRLSGEYNAIILRSESEPLMYFVLGSIVPYSMAPRCLINIFKIK